MPTLQVTTSFGDVEVDVRSADRIHLHASNEHPVVINRVPLGFRLDLARVEISGHRAEIGDTGWTYEYSSWTVDPSNWRRMGEYPSESARRKVNTVLIPEVIAAVSESPEMFYDAEREVLARDLANKVAAVEHLRNKLAEAITMAEDAERQLANFDRAGVVA